MSILLDSFLAVILGGLGNLPGSAVGAFVVALTKSIGGGYVADWSIAFLFVVVAVVLIVRPTGVYGPGDRRLLRLFRGVARRRWITLGSGDIFYHLTFIDDLVTGFRLCGTHPAAANRTYILAGGEVTTLNELVALIAAEAGVAAPRLHLPVWPVWTSARSRPDGGTAATAVTVPARASTTARGSARATAMAGHRIGRRRRTG